MSDDNKFTIPTQRERDEETLQRMQQANGGTLERDAFGILKLVTPITPRAEEASEDAPAAAAEGARRPDARFCAGRGLRADGVVQTGARAAVPLGDGCWRADARRTRPARVRRFRAVVRRAA